MFTWFWREMVCFLVFLERCSLRDGGMIFEIAGTRQHTARDDCVCTNSSSSGAYQEF